MPSQQVALGTGAVLSPEDVIAALTAAPKPIRITGQRSGAVLRLALGPITTDADLARRYKIRMHNLGGGVPFLGLDASDDLILLVIAFDQLLRVSKGEWLRFIREYWIDGPLSWSADGPDADWGSGLRMPAAIVQDARAIVLLGYQVGNQARSPIISKLWEAA